MHAVAYIVFMAKIKSYFKNSGMQSNKETVTQRNVFHKVTITNILFDEKGRFVLCLRKLHSLKAVCMMKLICVLRLAEWMVCDQNSVEMFLVLFFQT